MHTPVIERVPKTENESIEATACKCGCVSAVTDDQQTPVATTQAGNFAVDKLDKEGG